MDGNFKGNRPTESLYATLGVCLNLIEHAEQLVTIGGRCLDYEPGYEREFDVFEMRKENIREIMKIVRYGVNQNEEEKQQVPGVRGGDPVGENSTGENAY